MSLDDAAVFVAVVQAGSFSAAAREMRMPKSTVSRAVAELESSLGTQLLYRSTRSMALTDLGQRYFDEVLDAVQSIKDASDRLTRNEANMPYRLKLIASPDVGTEIIPEILVKFREKNTNVFVDVELTVTPPSLTGQKFDLALWGGPLPDSTLLCTTLQDSEFGLYAAPSYLQRRGYPRRPEDLESHDCILVRPDHGVQTWKLQSPQGPHTVTPPPSFSTNDLAFLRNTVVQGGGIGPMPTLMARRWEAQGALERVLPDYAMAGMPLYLLQPSRAFQTRAIEALKTSIIDWHRTP